jgi:hypothetical protein
MTVFQNVALYILKEVYDVSEVFSAFTTRKLTLMMEAASTYETSVNFCKTTRRNIPESSQTVVGA